MNLMAWTGLVVMIGSEAATLARIEPFWSWNTPIAWTGFILFADGIVWQARRNSWIRSNGREFILLAFASIPLWLTFEGYNRIIRNWYYTGLPENVALRMFGYAWSFATIWPAIFEAAELIGVLRARKAGAAGNQKLPALPSVPALPAFVIVVGVGMLMSPFVVPPSVAVYLAAPVWLGFIFLLDPINRRLHLPSFTGDLARGSAGRLYSFLAAGWICGWLWEFWNYWARGRWLYTFPIFSQGKIFEMPLPGYLGFPFFALECFTMYVTAAWLVSRKRTPEP